MSTQDVFWRFSQILKNVIKKKKCCGNLLQTVIYFYLVNVGDLSNTFLNNAPPAWRRLEF